MKAISEGIYSLECQVGLIVGCRRYTVVLDDYEQSTTSSRKRNEVLNFDYK